MEMEFGGTAARRLPVYLVLDVSSSMSGGPIDQVNQGVQLLYNELLNDPQAIETVWISVITFSKEAKQIVPLTELTRFTPPHPPLIVLFWGQPCACYSKQWIGSLCQIGPVKRGITSRWSF